MAVDGGRANEEGVVGVWFEYWGNTMDTVDAGLIIIYSCAKYLTTFVLSTRT